MAFDLDHNDESRTPIHFIHSRFIHHFGENNYVVDND